MIDSVIHSPAKQRMKVGKLLSSIFFIITFFPRPAFAQQAPEKNEIADSAKTLNEILIQWSRLQIPFSKQNRNITIIDRQTIKSLPVKSIGELLQYAAGIDVRQRGPWGVQADIGIDGGTFDQTLVLLNGVKITDSQTGHNMMNLPMSELAIERIEILKGAAARIYGVNAINGAINIITRQPEKTGIDISAQSGTSFTKDTSNHKWYAGFGAEIAAGLAGKNIDHFISVSHTSSSGYRYNTAFSNQKIFYQNQIAAGNNNKVNIMAGYANNAFGANAFYAAPADKESKEHVQTAIASISSLWHINYKWTFRPRISFRHNKDDYIFRRHDPEFYRNIHNTNAWALELNNTIKSRAGDFGIGFEMRNESINSNSLGKESRMNYGFFGEYSLNTIDKLLVNGGAYINYNSAFGWELLPGIDIGYDVAPNIRIFANAGTGQRLPTFTDLYYKGPSNIGNANLQPEHALHTELGLKYNSESINASLSYFHRRVSDFIDWVKDELTDPWQPQNFQKIKTNGISFSSDYRILNENNASSLQLISGLSYTWLHPKVMNNDPGKISQYALSNLRHHLALYGNLSYKKIFHFTLTARYQQRIHYKEYFLMDARVAADMNQWNIFIDGNNITNVTFVEAGAVPMPGSWVSLGIKWSKWK